MTTWTSEELNRIRVAEELESASPWRDSTLRKPVTNGFHITIYNVKPGKTRPLFVTEQENFVRRLHLWGLWDIIKYLRSLSKESVNI